MQIQSLYTHGVKHWGPRELQDADIEDSRPKSNAFFFNPPFPRPRQPARLMNSRLFPRP